MEKISPYVFVGLKSNFQSKVKSSILERINPLEILKVISNESNQSVDDIISRTRIQEVVEARQLFCHVIKERYDMPLSKIGKIIGRDHATVIHSLKVHSDRHDVNKLYRELTRRVFVEVDKLPFNDYSS